MMRQLTRPFAFDDLGAAQAQSAAAIGDEATLWVSAKAGDQLDGQRVEIHGDLALTLQCVAATPDSFTGLDGGVAVAGFTDELRAMLGA